MTERKMKDGFWMLLCAALYVRKYLPKWQELQEK